MRLRFGLLAIAVAAVVALGSRGAEASPIIFTDRAAFEATTQPNVLVTFDKAVDLGSVPNFWDFLLDDILHLQFVEEGGFLTVRDGSLHVGDAGPAAGHFGMVGGSLIRAIGFDVSTTAPPQGLVVFGNGTAVPFVFTSPTFIGLLFSSPVDSFQLWNAILPAANLISLDVVIDNMAIRTPEPSTLLLFGSGFIVLQVRRFLTKR